MTATTATVSPTAPTAPPAFAAPSAHPTGTGFSFPTVSPKASPTSAPTPAAPTAAPAAAFAASPGLSLLAPFPSPSAPWGSGWDHAPSPGKSKPLIEELRFRPRLGFSEEIGAGRFREAHQDEGGDGDEDLESPSSPSWFPDLRRTCSDNPRSAFPASGASSPDHHGTRGERLFIPQKSGLGGGKSAAASLTLPPLMSKKRSISSVGPTSPRSQSRSLRPSLRRSVAGPLPDAPVTIIDGTIQLVGGLSLNSSKADGRSGSRGDGKADSPPPPSPLPPPRPPRPQAFLGGGSEKGGGGGGEQQQVAAAGGGAGGAGGAGAGLWGSFSSKQSRVFLQANQLNLSPRSGGPGGGGTLSFGQDGGFEGEVDLVKAGGWGNAGGEGGTGGAIGAGMGGEDGALGVSGQAVPACQPFRMNLANSRFNRSRSMPMERPPPRSGSSAVGTGGHGVGRSSGLGGGGGAGGGAGGGGGGFGGHAGGMVASRFAFQGNAGPSGSGSSVGGATAAALRAGTDASMGGVTGGGIAAAGGGAAGAAGAAAGTAGSGSGAGELLDSNVADLVAAWLSEESPNGVDGGGAAGTQEGSVRGAQGMGGVVGGGAIGGELVQGGENSRPSLAQLQQAIGEQLKGSGPERRYEPYTKETVTKEDATDSFMTLYAAVTVEVEEVIEKSNAAVIERNLAKVAVLNAEIRRAKDILQKEIQRLEKLAYRKVKGVSPDEAAKRPDMVRTLMEKVQAIPDGIARGGGRTVASTRGVSDVQIDALEMGDSGPTGDHFISTAESRAFRSEYTRRVQKQDVELEYISSGLEKLRHLAQDMNEEMDRQDPMLEAVENKVNSTTQTLRNNNKRLKEILTEVRSPRKFCIDLILILVLLGIGAYLYSALK
ncbi:unnamed protein product [Closterium sp. Naga37s-1]|nr:unnamed protein product [Closterium sp. Naga37s-1]